MWFCARCGNRKPSPLSECATCASSETQRSAVATAPKPCPHCGTDVPGPSALGRLTCPACGKDFGDYEAWVAQCRAAAYAAHPAPSHTPPFRPGPPPPGLRGVAVSLFAAAALQVVAGLVAPDVLIACLLLAALQVAAGVALLKQARGADRVALAAAGFSSLLPVLVLPAFYFMWVFRYFTRPAATSHFGPPPEPASGRSQARVLVLLFVLVVAGLLVQAFVVVPALQTAYAWQEPPEGGLGAAHDVLHFYWRHSAWIIVGGIGGFWALSLLGAVRRRSFYRLSALAALALAAVGIAPAVPAADFRRAAARAEELLRETDLNQILWSLKQPDPLRRLAAARRLGELGRDARIAVPALEKALEDRDGRVRVAAALSLAAIDPRADLAAAVLIDALPRAQGPLWDVDALITALLHFGPRARPALPLLLQGLSTSSAAVPVLAEIGAPAVPGLIEALGRPEPEVRRRALEVLRRIGPAARGAAEVVEKAFLDPDPRVQEAAVLALGEVEREKAVSPLYELICGDSPLKPPAADALSALGEKDALMGPPRPGNHLNGIRRPAQWDHLRRLAIDYDLAGTCGELLEELAVQAVMCVEATPAAEGELRAFRRVYGSGRRRSALEIIQSLGVNFVLEEDRIRILSPAQAAEFWTAWLFEARAGRFR